MNKKKENEKERPDRIKKGISPPEKRPYNGEEEHIIPAKEDPDIIPEVDPFETPSDEQPEPGEGP